MISILGRKVSSELQVYIGLTRIYGIGKSQAKSLCYELVISPYLRCSQLTETQLSRIIHTLKEKNLPSQKR